MTILENLLIETEVPLKQVEDFQFLWCLDEHADFRLKGVLDFNRSDSVHSRNYRDKTIKVRYQGEQLFCGVILKTRFHMERGVWYVELWAVSASVKLDVELHREMFQDVSLTYKQMMQQFVSSASGNVICTVGAEPLRKPLICYEETVWQYAKRMASHFHTHVIADINTGRPNFWFGLRRGDSIKEHGLYCEQIELEKPINGQRNRLSYKMRGGEDYLLCDRLWIEDGWHTIYEKRACLERGEVVFSYMAAEERSIDSAIQYQENITGLSLKGTVEKTKAEQVYISLDIDGKSGEYPFPWYPETGTGLYAMPETGAKAEIYFMGADEREVIAIRCRDTEKTECDEKKLELPDGAVMLMNASGIKLEKNNRMVLSDSKIDFSGDKAIEITASGKVKISGKIVEVNAVNEIKYVTER